jgi:hypothetical protein
MRPCEQLDAGGRRAKIRLFVSVPFREGRVMAVLGHVADVLRTGLVCVTVGFLGYLAYSMIEPRLAHPPAKGDADDAAELAELRADVDRVREGVAAVEADCRSADRLHGDITDLRKALDDRSTAADIETARLRSELERLKHAIGSGGSTGGGLPAGTLIEYGSVLFEGPEDFDSETCRRIHFKNKYESPPLVFTNQWQTTGFWIIAHTHDVTTTGARMCISLEEENKDYRCQIAYVVIGRAP